MRQIILITRPEADSVEAKNLLKQQNYHVITHPFIQVLPQDFTMPDLTGFEGLILTSANAVRAIPNPLSRGDIPIFCVGEQTKQAAIEAGLHHIQSISADVAGLINVMDQRPKYKRYLYLRGEYISRDIKAALPDVRIEEIIVYRTEKIKKIDYALVEQMRRGNVDAVLFYSKRTAQAFTEAISLDPEAEKLKESLERTRALCLGDSMVQSVSVLPWKEIQVAAQPTQKSLLALIDYKESKEMGQKKIQEKNKMSNNAKQPMTNAAKIIERFGGIRPMAAKIDTPVTTVQGWKKRDVIPATRREQILTAAADNNIDISDFIEGASIPNENIEKPDEDKSEAKSNEASSASEIKETQSEDSTSQDTNVEESTSEESKPADTVASFQDKVEEKAKQDEQPQEPAKAAESSPQSQTHDNILAAIEANNKKTLAKSAWIAAGMIVATAIIGAFLLWPSMKEKDAKLQALEEEVSEVSEKTSILDQIVPDNMQEKMDDLQIQARNIQNTFEQLSDRAQDMSAGVMDLDSGPISRRLMVLEEQMAALSGASNFGGLVSRIRQLEESIPGQTQLQNSVLEMRSIVNRMERRQGTITEGLEEAQSDARGALGQTLEGVSGNDLKAAAMLIAFSQLRDSLNREAPFQTDLALLEKLAGNDNPELKDSLRKLSPHADGGVLTASGLSGEFRGLAGDILESSLKGEELSFGDKFKARFNNLMKIEKDGELVNGTSTQITIAKAQNFLNEGDIQGAINELQTLDGEAAKTAEPFIKEAKVSLLAERVQQMLGENILSRIQGQLPDMPADMGGMVSMPDMTGQLNMDEVRQTLENTVPLGNEKVIRDEESGISILPGQQGFRGFSVGE